MDFTGEGKSFKKDFERFKAATNKSLDSISKSESVKEFNKEKALILLSFAAFSAAMLRKFKKSLVSNEIEGLGKAKDIFKNNKLKHSRILNSQKLKNLRNLSLSNLKEMDRVINSYKISVSSFLSRLKRFTSEQKLLESTVAKAHAASLVKSSSSKAKFLNTLKKQAKEGIILVGERRFPIALYAELVVSSSVSSAFNDSVKVVSLNNSISRVMISSSGSRDWCSFFEGKVFSLLDDDPVYPSISSIPNGGPPFHPNCVHYLIPVVSDTKQETVSKAFVTKDTKFLRRKEKKLRK